jgi:hypothetical protein
MNTGRGYSAGFGSQTSAVAASGTPYSAATEEYNGSSWTSVNNMNTARQQAAASGSSETAGIVFGGEIPPATLSAATESYNGSTWTTSPASLATARIGLMGAGQSSSSALAMQGAIGPPGPAWGGLTEEWNDPTLAVQKITTS